MLRTIARGNPSPAWRRVLRVPNPAAGVDVTVNVPGQRYWQLLGVACRLTASAVAGNRFPALTLRDTDGITLAKIASPTAITAALAPDVTWTPGVGAATVVAASYVALTLPEHWYMAPQESLTITGHTGVADQWSNVRVTIIETIPGDPVFESNLEASIMDHWRAIHELTVGV